MTPKISPKRERGQGHVTPLNFWALNANSSKTVKATDFKFDKHVSRDRPVKNFPKGAAVKIHLAEICTLTSAFYLSLVFLCRRIN